jgi:hypothetical protein
LGGLGKSRPADYPAKAVTQDKALLQNFRAMLNHLVFIGMDKKMCVYASFASSPLPSHYLPLFTENILAKLLFV